VVILHFHAEMGLWGFKKCQKFGFPFPLVVSGPMWNLSGVDYYWEALRCPDMGKSRMLHMDSLLIGSFFFLSSNLASVFDVS
jgi:hypothetical protein